MLNGNTKIQAMVIQSFSSLYTQNFDWYTPNCNTTGLSSLQFGCLSPQGNAEQGKWSTASAKTKALWGDTVCSKQEFGLAGTEVSDHSPGPLAAVSTQAAGSPIRGVVVSAGLAPSMGKSPVVPMDWRSLLLAACLTSSLLQAWTAEVHQSLAHADSPEKSDLIPSQGANSSTPST